MGINIVFAHTNKIETEKQNMIEKQINKCQNLATNFWKCLHKHSHLKEVAVNCGPEYFNMIKCINKIK